jgi:hypothetical protein
MHPLKAATEIDHIVARLRKIGCSDQQVARHVEPLQRKYGITQSKQSKDGRHKRYNGHHHKLKKRERFATERIQPQSAFDKKREQFKPVQARNGFTYDKDTAAHNLQKRYKVEEQHQTFRDLDPHDPHSQRTGVDLTAAPPWR